MTAVNVTDYFAGDSYVHDYVVRDQKARIINLTGASARWAIFPVGRRTAGRIIYQATSAAEITFPDPLKGKLRVSVPVNTILTPGEFEHQLEVTLSTGQSQTVAKGRFVINPSALLAAEFTNVVLLTGAPVVGNPVLAVV